jgi:hypothetical protein
MTLHYPVAPYRIVVICVDDMQPSDGAPSGPGSISLALTEPQDASRPSGDDPLRDPYLR